MKSKNFTKNSVAKAVLVGLALSLTACSDDYSESEAREDARDEAQTVAREAAQVAAAEQIAAALSAVPSGVGFEQYVAIPRVNYPLPATSFLNNNNGNGRFYLDSNPVNYALSGINSIWKGTTDTWQKTAGDYKRDVNGYKAGDGPNPHHAVNGQPSDYVAPGTEIIDAEAWKANIQYVVKVTKNRTEQQEYYAFLDDVRSKNYSVIDGFGALTEDYAAASGAYAEFETILASDVTKNRAYAPDNNDSFTQYGGKTDSILGDMVQLASRFRNSSASTSGPKYLYGTPRPWRMDDEGKVDFKGVETLECIDGSSATRETIERRIDSYTTNVNVIPGLYCGRRAHSNGHEDKKLYSTETENRRKDNGYPSGHTNAAFLGSLAYAYAMPELFAEHVMRGSDLGENRIIAGMHSPVDVMGGRMQAQIVATYALVNHPEEAKAALDQSRKYFGAKAASKGMSLYEYAQRKAEKEGSFTNEDGSLNVNVFNNNRYQDKKTLRDTYLFRMTYGLPQNGVKGLAPIVPENAEVLLKSRMPYLTDAQRRAVLATTSIDSGYPLLDASNGWGRINLVAASDGYGAFEGDVHVNMSSSDGGFSAHDHWNNDISGAGMLSKEGTGKLTLTGQNTYEGGTVIKGGILEAESTTAFGTGDVYLASGEVEIDVNGELVIAKNYTQKSGVMTVMLDEDANQVAVSGNVTINQGELLLDAKMLEKPAVGHTFSILTTTGNLNGEFTAVRLLNADFNIQLEYSENNIVATLIE